MANHNSASMREPHVTEPITTITISDALKRRAHAVVNDRSIDPQWRVIVRYALETSDPWLADLVRRADAGETIIDTIDFSQEPEINEEDSSDEKIATLAEIICRASEESAGALLVLMDTLENSTHPKVLANAAKHFAFTHCCESNLYGMVDAQIAIVESELLASNVLPS